MLSPDCHKTYIYWVRFLSPLNEGINYFQLCFFLKSPVEPVSIHDGDDAHVRHQLAQDYRKPVVQPLAMQGGYE